MWCSAANSFAKLATALGLIVSLALVGAASPLARKDLSSFQINSAERSLWAKLQPSILLLTESHGVKEPYAYKRTGSKPATVMIQTRVLGSAVCIDSSGLFLAHQNSVHGATLYGVRSDGSAVTLHVLSSDQTTELVLLQVVRPSITPDSISALDDFDMDLFGTPEEMGTEKPIVTKWTPIEVAKDIQRGRVLLGVLPTGPVRAEVISADIVAAGRGTHQIVAVNEIHFDAVPQMLAGALLFDESGKLVGLLGAISGTQANQSLARGLSNITLRNPHGQERQPAGGGGFGGVRFGANNALSNFGPSGLQEAFALAPIMLSRVVSGFKSVDHLVRHPALGATCSDALNSNGISVGALVKQVAPDSAAAKAGLIPGDIIVLIDGSIVNNPIDYVWSMLNKEVGQSVRITIRRGDAVLELNGVVGSASVNQQIQNQVQTSSQTKSSTPPHGPDKN